MAHAAKFGSGAFDFRESLNVSSHIDFGGGVFRRNTRLPQLAGLDDDVFQGILWGGALQTIAG